MLRKRFHFYRIIMKHYLSNVRDKLKPDNNQTKKKTREKELLSKFCCQNRIHIYTLIHISFHSFGRYKNYVIFELRKFKIQFDIRLIC